MIASRSPPPEHPALRRRSDRCRGTACRRRSRHRATRRTRRRTGAGSRGPLRARGTPPRRSRRATRTAGLGRHGRPCPARRSEREPDRARCPAPGTPASASRCVDAHAPDGPARRPARSRLHHRPACLSIPVAGARRYDDGADRCPTPRRSSMRYLLLIYGPPFDPSSVPAEVMEGQNAAYAVFTKEVLDRGIMQGGEALQPSTAATSVRVRDGEALVTDGPFAETKEELGGFYLLDCRDLDEAIELAARIPGAKHGTIEVRPILELGDEYLEASGRTAAGAAG